MSTATENQVQAFYDYLGRRLATGTAPASPEASVAEFRRYQEELKRFCDGTIESLQQSETGQSRPLDVDVVMQRSHSLSHGNLTGAERA